MSRVEGKRFIVTGASKGIGLSPARALRARGARVVVTARNRERLEAAAAQIGAIPVVADVGSEKDAVRSVAEAVEHLGGLDGVVNNAGVGIFQRVDGFEVQDFRRLLDVNVVGAALMVREAVPHLRESGGGDIVNVSSTSGLKGDPGATLYSASKFALRGMTQCWQAELRPDKIRVILVNPSHVETGFGAPSEPAAPQPNLLHGEDIGHAILSTLEMNPRGFVPELIIFATCPW